MKNPLRIALAFLGSVAVLGASAEFIRRRRKINDSETMRRYQIEFGIKKPRFWESGRKEKE